jgi:GNAT superfamily N-acetyltransferase
MGQQFHTLLSAAADRLGWEQLFVKPASNDAVSSVIKLHRFAKQAGQPSFSPQFLKAVTTLATQAEACMGSSGTQAAAVGGSMIGDTEAGYGTALGVLMLACWGVEALGAEPQVVGALVGRYTISSAQAPQVAAAAVDRYVRCQSPQPPVLELVSLVVRADVRRHGLGRALLHSALECPPSDPGSLRAAGSAQFVVGCYCWLAPGKPGSGTSIMAKLLSSCGFAVTPAASSPCPSHVAPGASPAECYSLLHSCPMTLRAGLLNGQSSAKEHAQEHADLVRAEPAALLGMHGTSNILDGITSGNGSRIGGAGSTLSPAMTDRGAAAAGRGRYKPLGGITLSHLCDSPHLLPQVIHLHQQAKQPDGQAVFGTNATFHGVQVALGRGQGHVPALGLGRKGLCCHWPG